MLKVTRMRTTTILAIVLVICGLSVPNFVSDEIIGGWPKWAQRRITLAPELQGGTYLVLEVDRNRVREYVLTSLLREVRDVLRSARIGLASPMGIRNDSVEVRPLAGDFEPALLELGKLSRAFNGVRPVEVADAGGGLIRLTPTEAGLREYEPPMVDRAIREIRDQLSRVHDLSVEREGTNRVTVQVPRLLPEELYSWKIYY